jgi:imidazole glycerol-phosphate synthase subunit HisF
MVCFRIIPVLLIDDEECFKIIKFKKKIYIGDPINIIKIFNDLGVDEIFVLNISRQKKIDLNFLKKLSGESFIPLTYGGNIKNLTDVENIIKLGYEKISINSLLFENIKMVKSIIQEFGSSTINISVNIHKNFFNQYKIYDYKKKKDLSIDIFDFLKQIQDLEPGEILINFVHNDGTKKGFDFDILKKIKPKLNTNIIVYGGLSSEKEIVKIKDLGFDGVGASSLFCFQDNFDSILINYISNDLKELIYDN